MLQQFEVTSSLLDNMTKINQACYTQEDQVSPFSFRMMKEKLDKEKERDENISKIMSQMELLQKQVLQTIGEPNEVRRVCRLEKGSHPRYLKMGGNQDWNSHKKE